MNKVPVDPQIVTTANTVTETALILCRKCKKTCPSESFSNAASVTTYATCSNCRLQDHAQRFPTVFEPAPIRDPENNNGKIFN